MPGVNSVAPRVQGGLLDTVLKGVQVARDVYGIKHEMAATDAQEQAAAQSKQNFEDEQAGNFTPKEVVGLGKNYNFVDEGTPNAQRIGRKGPDGVEDAYILPRKEGSPLVSTVNDAMVGGKHGTASYDLNTGGLLHFVETSKPTKDVTPKYSPTVLDNGNLGAFDQTTGKVVDTGQAAGAKPKAGALLAGDDAPPDPKAVAKEREGLKKTFIDSGQRSNVGVLKNKILTAGSLQTLIDAHPDGQMTPQFQTEIAMGLSKMIMGSAPTEGTIEKMDAQTRGTFIANMMQKITNEPVDANNPKFIAQFADVMAQARYAAPNLFKADQDGFYGIMGAKKADFDTSGGNFVYTPKANKEPKADGEKESGTALAAPQLAPTKSGYAPNQPTSVIQNGHTYNLNPATGKYE